MAGLAERGLGNLSLDSFFSESGFTGFQDLADQTFESVFGAGQGQQAAADASTQAQGAYDQLWTDYYTAVDTTAQTYYDTVSASTDYALQAYQEAVDYTTQAVDDYAGTYADYAAYCATYSWDCYSYTYDSTSGSYSYTGDTSSTATTQVTIGDVTINGSYPAETSPTPSADAYEALVVFANDQLAVTVDPLYAGSFTGDVQTIMAYLPAEIQALLLNATSISGNAYWGLMAGGAGVVLVGDCASSPSACAVNSDNLTTQLSSASAGTYGFLVSAAAPTSADAALQLVTQVYPKFTGLSFAQVTDVETGYLFMATTASMGIDPVTYQPVSVVKVIYSGVVTVNGQSFVYTLVGIGEGYVNILNQR